MSLSIKNLLRKNGFVNTCERFFSKNLTNIQATTRELPQDTNVNDTSVADTSVADESKTQVSPTQVSPTQVSEKILKINEKFVRLIGEEAFIGYSKRAGLL